MELPMVRVRIASEMPFEREHVWDELARLEDHAEWMLDATAIRFEGEQRRGAGTRFECDTRFGPLRLTDVMEVTEWEHGERIGVRHRGVVSGAGSFTLRDVPGPATRVEWEELLVLSLVARRGPWRATRETPLHRRMEREPPSSACPHRRGDEESRKQVTI